MHVLHHARAALLTVSLAVLGSACGGALAASQKEFDAQMGVAGLQRIKVKNVGLVYALPGATLASYDSVMIDPRVDVAFRKDFNPQRAGTNLKLSTAELNNIRAAVGKAVHEEFVQELTSGKGKYRLADKPGPRVLDVRIAIGDLYANAPATSSLTPSTVYSVSAGSMTLGMELRDAETGAVLARVFDTQEARNAGRLTLTDKMTNEAEVRAMARGWARIMRERMDAAHGIGQK
jgi:hypothetical protein